MLTNLFKITIEVAIDMEALVELIKTIVPLGLQKYTELISTITDLQAELADTKADLADALADDKADEAEIAFAIAERDEAYADLDEAKAQLAEAESKVEALNASGAEGVQLIKDAAASLGFALPGQ